MYKQLSSLQNPLIKDLFQLREKSKKRNQSKQFLIEGKREIVLALKGNYQIDKLLFCDEIFEAENIPEILSFANNTVEVYQITKEIYQKLAYRESTEGLIAVSKSKELTLKDLKFKNSNPLILVAEAPEKPGNIGAILRTADAANLDAIIIANPKTDLYNPNIIRSSIGCIFTNQIATGSSTEIIDFLKQNNINIFCASLEASKEYHTIDYQQSSAIVVGTEATGLSEEWLKNSSQNIIIPMQGKIDSMNVSVAAGILIFEAKRQRNFN